MYHSKYVVHNPIYKLMVPLASLFAHDVGVQHNCKAIRIGCGKRNRTTHTVSFCSLFSRTGGH